MKMVNEDLLGGLKSALSRGQSLKQAMASFYNAGYKKEDIELAAKALQTPQIPQKIQQPVQPVQPIQQPPRTKQIQKLPQQTPPKIIQRVSKYEQSKPKGKWLLFIMIFILLILLGILASVILFKQELAEFFNNLFG